jgi:hypothetical protein
MVAAKENAMHCHLGLSGSVGGRKSRDLICMLISLPPALDRTSSTTEPTLHRLKRG